MTKVITIVPPDPTWAARFHALAAAIRPHLPPGAALHHIGSTAVPGLRAKDVTDLQIGLTAVSSCIEGPTPRPSIPLPTTGVVRCSFRSIEGALQYS